MPRQVPSLARLLDLHQIRYLIVAGAVTLLYLGLFGLGLLIGWHYLVAMVVAQIVTIFGAFPVYRSLVFQSKGGLGGDFLRFLSVWSTGAVAGLVATPFLVEVLSMHPLVAQVLAIVVVAVGSYLGHRWFSFRDTGVSGP